MSADGYADHHGQIGQGTNRWQAMLRALDVPDSGPRLLLELADINDLPVSMR
ncbi:hypothetical protein [Aliiruegeria sabulilitoris]|uniref:hypothetical protein n=1 Tax=Aliiruegeria sabulilitoris TaxID=1510458 RepID=UPI0012E3394F|nr:hypothetical protein [Aliiruegeria sabulilitoris]